MTTAPLLPIEITNAEASALLRMKAYIHIGGVLDRDLLREPDKDALVRIAGKAHRAIELQREVAS